MLKTLWIRNFTLISELELNLNKGLNIITGETGAGKSILIDAIDLAFGARSSKDQIKTGASKAIIELQVALSDGFPLEVLEDNGIDVEEDKILTISREIQEKGTRSRINGVLVTQGFVQDLRKYLIDIHSQHQTYAYIQPKTHIDLLDNYGSSEHKNALAVYLSTYKELLTTKKEFEQAKANNSSTEQKVDFLKFQIEEIEKAQIEDVEEYENLCEERSVLVNAEELKELTYSSYSCLYEQDSSIVDVLATLENKLIKACEYDKKLEEVVDMVSTSSINLKDAAASLRNYSEDLETNEERLGEVEERIILLDKLRRKYGSTLTDILYNYEKFKQELNQIEFSAEHVEQLSQKIQELELRAKKQAKELSVSRQKLAEELSALIQSELLKLDMPKVVFEVKLSAKEDLSSRGFDEVEFFISTNPGEPLKPLSKVASGGEISRVMLAMKTVFAKADGVNTVIFDEIDSGISGRASQAVAEELARLAVFHQILCITHQPIIAAMADEYLYVEKIQTIDSTESKITLLDEVNKISAISKLASGGENQDSINFATKLIEQSKSFKSSL